METLLKQSFCDTISENRNKAFGQYELRTTYPDRIFRAQFLVISSFSVLILMAVWLSPEIKADEVKDISIPVILSDVVIDITMPDKAGKKIVEPEVKPETEPKTETDPTKTKLLEAELVDDDKGLKIDSSAQNSEEADNKPNTGLQGTGQANNNDGKLLGDKSGGGNEGGKNEIAGSSGLPLESDPIDFAEVEPAFQGDLQNFISKATRYPGKAIDEGVEGQVFVCFIVDEKGKVTKPEVLKGIGYGCDEEAIRVIKTLPAFSPGKMNGHPVKVRMRMPFSFKLKK